MDWLDLLAVQGTLKSLLQHHSSIIWRSTFFIFQLSHPYMTTGKTIALTRCTCVDKVVSLLFNMLSRWVTTFLPRSKRLNFMAAVTICSDFGAPQNKVSPFKPPQKNKKTVSPSICHEVMGLDTMMLVFWILSFAYLNEKGWKGIGLRDLAFFFLIIMRLASFKTLPGRYESSTGRTQKAGISFGVVTGWPWESEVAFEAIGLLNPSHCLLSQTPKGPLGSSQCTVLGDQARYQGEVSNNFSSNSDFTRKVAVRPRALI